MITKHLLPKKYHATMVALLYLAGTNLLGAENSYGNAPFLDFGAGIYEQSIIKSSEQQATVIIDEDFSGLTAGTEDNPDPTSLLDEKGWLIDKTKFKPWDYDNYSNWGGDKLFSAGGCLAVYNGGFFNTPVGDYSGVLKLSCRVRMAKGQQDLEEKDRYIYILLMRKRALIDFKRINIKLTEQWQDITFEADNGWWNDCTIQVSTNSRLSFLVDDLRIVHTINNIEPPKSQPALKLWDTGFKATWLPTTTAEQYLLSVYSKEPNPDNDNLSEDFENIKTDAQDKSLVEWNTPNYPQGWEFSLTQKIGWPERELYNKETDPDYVIEGQQAICFDKDGDYIVTPQLRFPIRGLHFWVRVDDRLQPKDVHSVSRLYIDIYTQKSGWMPWKFFLLEDLRKNGATDVDFTTHLNDYPNVLRFRLRLVKDNSSELDDKCLLALDRFVLDAPGTPIKKFALKDVVVNKPTKDDELVQGRIAYDVNHLDPNTDYFYSVKAKNQIHTSKESDEVEVFDVSDPIALEATAVTDEGYTATWKCNNKVDYFKVMQYLKFVAGEDMPNYVVLEENFDKIKNEGTPENPVDVVGNSTTVLIDDFTQIPGWTASSYALANGMFGGAPAQKPHDIGGMLVTPTMDLSHNGGSFKIKIKVWAKAGDLVNVIGVNPQLTMLNILREVCSFLCVFCEHL